MTPMTEQKKRNQSVDTFRLFAALFVVILHLRYDSLPRDVAVGLRLMSRWAIPFFFIISGYFLALKYSKTKRLDVLPTVERLIWIFLLWVLIYSPFVVMNHNLTTLLKLITSPTFIYFGLFSHLWFLPSLMFGYLFISFCHHYNIKILLPIASLAAIIVALLAGSYTMFDIGFPLDYEVARNWLSIPFLYLGFLFFQKGYPNKWVSILLIVFGTGAQIFEAKFLYSQYEISAYDHQFLLGTIPFAIGMAALSLSEWKLLQHPILASWGDQYSLGIYLLHPAVIFTFMAWMSRYIPGLADSALWELLTPVAVVLISLAVLSLLQKRAPLFFKFLFGAHISKRAADE